MSGYIGLDFETYGSVNLPVHGLERYVSDKYFQPLIACVAQPWKVTDTIDFTVDYEQGVTRLAELLKDKMIVAHNAGFERRVLKEMGIDLPANRFVDSAVVARAMGAGGSLEAAAPQLLNMDKLESGKALIQLFSIPGKYQEEDGLPQFTRRIVEDHPTEWAEFERYCRIDAELGLSIVEEYAGQLPWCEMANQAITMEMNAIGWHVDVPVVEEMQRRYLENVELAVEQFRQECDAVELNLNSLKQLKEWCLERGIRASSFDEKHVARTLARIDKKVSTMHPHDPKLRGYVEVLRLLETKQILGGSSLKKLKVILDTVGEDGRLRDQYLHVGAPQTYRTTGRSVQMQNLKRLKEPADMVTLFDDDCDWSNDEMAANLRQVFTATDPNGALIVGDFKSVENVGLAWLACQADKLVAFKKGLDPYKVQAAKIYGVPYEQVTKAQRQTGKVGELSCGYQAGSGAVLGFAEGMGVEMSEGEAAKLVTDWRSTNPYIVELWDSLDERLNRALDSNDAPALYVGTPSEFRLVVRQVVTPASLLQQHGSAQSLAVEVFYPDGELLLRRYFHGCYRRGRNICYYKPSERKTGALWTDRYTDPKSKQVVFRTIYGGKLTGIVTQSLCREIFFNVLRKVAGWVGNTGGLELIGQFHDEIVLDWAPGDISLSEAKRLLERSMSDPGRFLGFPLGADVKHDYRYTK